MQVERNIANKIVVLRRRSQKEYRKKGTHQLPFLEWGRERRVEGQWSKEAGTKEIFFLSSDGMGTETFGLLSLKQRASGVRHHPQSARTQISDDLYKDGERPKNNQHSSYLSGLGVVLTQDNTISNRGDKAFNV